MNVETVKISELISPEYNPRHITPEAMESLKQSLDEFGYISPVIVNKHNNHILAGNQRITALKQLGYNEIDVIYINEPDINREKALNIRLNNNSGDWDIGKLDTIFQDLELTGFDLTLTGFETDNLQPFETETEIETDDDTVEIPVSETITSDLNTGLKPETNIKPDVAAEPVDQVARRFMFPVVYIVLFAFVNVGCAGVDVVDLFLKGLDVRRIVFCTASVQ